MSKHTLGPCHVSDLLAALHNLVNATARARKADDAIYGAGQDPTKAQFDEQEDAHATLIIYENEARAAIARATESASDQGK